MAKPIPVTDVKDLSGLWTGRVQNRNAANSDLRPIYGIDTETWQGDIFLIADSDGRYLDKITPLSVIEFLFHKKYQNAWNFFYNIGYDANVILKQLGSSRLSKYLQTRRLSFEFEEYSIHYIPHKILRVTKGHHSSAFYDIAQFYGRGKLADVYQKNIGALDEQYLRLKNLREEFSPRFYRRNTSNVRNYCIKDCILTKDLSVHWVDNFHEIFGFYPQRWISPGYLAEKVLINRGIAFPTFASIPSEKQSFAFQSYFGARFEMLKRGFLGGAFQYDINSAYPKAIAELPDLMKGQWTEQKRIKHDAALGFFKILADVPDDMYIPPFPFRTNNLIIFPSGKFITYATLDELRACGNTVKYDILQSYQFIPSNSERKPYKYDIEEMYDKRLALKKAGDDRQLPIKLILNSIYGKTGQKINGIIGNLFNPVIFAYITGYTRAQLYRFLLQHNLCKEVISFATDSITVSKDLGINSERLGEFALKGSCDDYFGLQNGFNRMNDEWKQRGFGKLEGKTVENVETKARDGKLMLTLEVKRDTPIRSAIRQNRVNDIGKIRTVERELNLMADRKRLWLGRLESVNARIWNDSLPLPLNHFFKEEI